MNLFKRIATSLGLVLILTISLPGGVARAHVLKQSNGISGVLHVPPNDEPRAGGLTKIGISFADKNGAFSLQDCDCEVSIVKDDETVQTALPEPALKGATLDSFSTVTFPSAGVYDIIASGASKTGTFSGFELKYTVRVASESGSAANSPVNSKNDSGSTMLIVAIGSLAVLAMVAFVAIGQGGRYVTTPAATKTKETSTKTKQ